MSDSEELVELPEEEDDLFGDEPADEVLEDRSRAGSERDDAASDQDAGEGYGRDDEAPAITDYETKVIEAVEMQRHRIPKAKDQRVSRHGGPSRPRRALTMNSCDLFASPSS